MFRRCTVVLGVLCLVFSGVSSVSAQTNVFNMGGTRDPVTGIWTGQASLEFVTVGDAGNAADTATGSHYGSVPYTYEMGKYDVTAAQYTAFLNAVAATDTYGLYNANMGSGCSACGIWRGGSSGSYSYSLMTPDSGNLPVNYVSWGDAARFCNWLQDGQPTGAEGSGTTETGAYTLIGATSKAALMAVTRNAGARYFIPTENEWYKAAYYKGGGTNAGYWAYPTQSNTPPDNSWALAATEPNDANCYLNGYTYPGGGGNMTIVGEFVLSGNGGHTTPVGAFAASPGPYGTYDMGGNLNQWNETNVSGGRGMRGGSFGSDSVYLGSSHDSGCDPTLWGTDLGFRVACIPEPSTFALLFVGGIGLLACAWRRQRVS